MVTIYDLSKLTGVSYRTVSRVINNEPNVDRNTREKVLKAVEKTGYVPNEGARKLRLGIRKGQGRKKTFNIGCIVFIKDFSRNSTHYLLLLRIGEEVVEQGYNLLFTYSTDQLIAKPTLMGKINQDSIDGLVVVGGISAEEQGLLDRIAPNMKNIVLTGRSSNLQFDCVGIDLEQSGREAVNYLIGLGHRRIAFIGRPSPQEGRFAGYRDALEKAGIQYDPALAEAGSADGLDAGYAYMKTILERAGHPPTAVFASNDLFAIGAMNAAKDKGLDVPGDISIVGFDNVGETRVTSPKLTTMDTKREEVGKLLVRKLIERIDNPGFSPSRTLLVADLVIRDSCRPPKS